MKKSQRISIAVVATLSLALVVGAAYYGDFLGARFIKKGSPRLTVRQGEINTLELAPSNHTRKLEICTEKRNTILGRSDFIECRTLQSSVDPQTTEAAVIIPANMPLGRAIVITRIRDVDGTLVPAAPSDEKITLFVTPPRKLTGGSTSSSVAQSVTQAVRQAVGGGQSSSAPTRAPSPTPTCVARPACLDSVPVCLVAVPAGGWCPSPTRIPTPLPPTPTPIPTPARFRYCSMSPQTPYDTSSPYTDLVWNVIEFLPDPLRSGQAITVRTEIQNTGTKDSAPFYISVSYDKNRDAIGGQWNLWDDTQSTQTGNYHQVLRLIPMAGLKAGAKTTFAHLITNTSITKLQYHRLTMRLNDNFSNSSSPLPTPPGGWSVDATWLNNIANCYFEIQP